MMPRSGRRAVRPDAPAQPEHSTRPKPPRVDRPLQVERRRDAVGELVGTATSEPKLLLAPGFPLSHLRVKRPDGMPIALVRLMIESGGPTLRHSVPVLFDCRADIEPEVDRLRQFGVTPVFPILTDAGEETTRVLALIGSSQLGALCEDPDALRDLVAQDGVPAFAGIRFDRAYRLQPADIPFAPKENDRHEYWNSVWSFVGSPDVNGCWRVRPNLRRDRVRGEFVAVLSPEAHRVLGKPAYVIVVNPYFPDNRLPAWVIVEAGLPAEEQGHHAIYVDRPVRETLGVADGEFCRVHPWTTETVGETFRRWTYRKGVGPRTLVAHIKMPLKSDTEKPVCRMSSSSLSALGVPSGGFVTLEAMSLEQQAGADVAPRWRAKRIRRRVLEVDEATMERRESWESDQAPNYVDCAGRYAIFPPYPDIYLDFFARKELGDLAICGVVQVRAAIWSRLLDEASEFAWLGIIGVVAAVAATIGLPVWGYLALAVALTLTLVFVRVRRAVR
jgi:hypothetical protein